MRRMTTTSTSTTTWRRSGECRRREGWLAASGRWSSTTATLATSAASARASGSGDANDDGGTNDSDADGGSGTKDSGEKKRVYRPGAFGRLPNVSPAEQLIVSAVKRAGRVTATKGLKDAARERNKSAKQLDALTTGVCKPLKEYVKGFPAPERLHPFERALLELTLSDKKYRMTIEAVDSMRKGILGIGKGYASQVTKTTGIKDAEEMREKGFAEVESYYRRHARYVDDLKSIAQLLRRLPVAELETPTVALVGAPNVGKSSLVRVLSSGTPEVCNYPFTTKGIKMGHFQIEDQRHVVTDTPGLINRAADERNQIELLTIATLEHLPTCVIFVTDLSGLSGTSVKDQLELREELYNQFAGRRPWIDVFSKAALVPVLGGETDPDMASLWLEEELEEAKSALERIPGATQTSADEGWGIDELKDRLAQLLKEHKRTLPAARSPERRDKSEEDKPEYIQML